MLKPLTADQLQDATNLAFEIQAVIKIMGKRCLDLAEADNIDRMEIHDFSRVTDLCTRMLDDLASALDRVMPLEEPNQQRRGAA